MLFLSFYFFVSVVLLFRSRSLLFLVLGLLLLAMVVGFRARRCSGCCGC